MASFKSVQFKEQHAADTNSPLSEYTCVSFNQYFDNTSLQSNQAEINSLAISKLMYLASVLGTPDGSVFSGVHKAMFAFIWNNKPDQIKRDILF